MENLAYWDCAETFTAIEAAYLIRGINPNDDPAMDEKRVKPIIERMQKDFDATCWNVLSAAYDGEEPETLKEYSKKGLLSIMLEELISDIATDDNNIDLIEFYAAKRAQEKYPEDSENIDFEMEKHFPFKEQKFCREVLHNWSAKNNVPSEYKFSHGNLNQEQNIEMPLETRERHTLLIIIASLCKSADYDYEKHSKTAELIIRSSALLGWPLGRRTIENHLKKISPLLKTEPLLKTK